MSQASERPTSVGEELKTPENTTSEKSAELTEDKKRKVDFAAKAIDQLIKDGKINNADIYMSVAKDPETQKTIDSIQEAFGYDIDKLSEVEKQVKELQLNKEKEEQLTSMATTTAETLFYSQDKRKRSLQENIKQSNTDGVFSDLKDMQQFSEDQLKELATILANSDKAKKFLATIQEHYDKLTEDVKASL